MQGGCKGLSYQMIDFLQPFWPPTDKVPSTGKRVLKGASPVGVSGLNPAVPETMMQGRHQMSD